AQICAACHGLDRRGNAAQNVPSLLGVSQKLKADDIVRLLGTGRGVMPSFGFLSERQKTLLAATVLGVQSEPGDSARGGAIAGDDVLGGIPYSFTGYNRWVDTNGYPVIKPPWGTLNAIDLNTGDFRWRVPLGELSTLKALGIPRTGLENYGGPGVTPGGVLFIAATKDEMLRAFGIRHGELLLENNVPPGGYVA